MNPAARFRLLPALSKEIKFHGGSLKAKSIDAFAFVWLTKTMTMSWYYKSSLNDSAIFTNTIVLATQATHMKLRFLLEIIAQSSKYDQ